MLDLPSSSAQAPLCSSIDNRSETILLLYFEVLFKTIVFSTLCFLPQALKLVLDTFPGVGDIALKCPDTFLDKRKYLLLNQFPKHLRDLCAIGLRETSTPDLLLQVQLLHEPLFVQVSAAEPEIFGWCLALFLGTSGH